MKRLLILSLLLASAPAGAEIVKWVDSQGRVHYSDQPPPAAKGQQQMNIKNQPGSLGGTSATQKSTAEQEQDFRKRQMDAADAEKKAAEDKKQAEIAKQNCASARGNLKSLQEGVRLTKYNEQGERVFLDDAERAKAMEDAQRAVKDWCK